MELDQATIEELRKKGRESLFFLSRAILSFSDFDPKIHLPICRELENHEINTRMSVELPRTWFKSTLVSISYAIWRVINDPNIRILIAQNIHSNACKKLSAIAAIFEKNALFKVLYPEILPNKNCRWSSDCLEVNRSAAHPEGTFEAAGVGTSTTSRHYDLIIEDDTISPKKDDMTGIIQQPTKMDMEKAIGWHGLCHPMLLHPSKSQIVIVGTRWAERDLLGFVYENFPEYKNIKRTAIEDPDGNAFGDAVLNAERDELIIKSPGKVTWPERFNSHVLAELFKTEGPYMFACLYLGMPTAAINQVFKREWITYFENHKKGSFACTSVDLASAEKEESSDPDFNVVMTTAIEPESGRIYVLEYTRERMSPSDVIDTIFRHYHRYHPIKVLVEAIGYQRTLVHWLRQRQQKTNTQFYVEEIKGHKQSKVDRIRGLQPFFSASQIAIRAGMSMLEHELLAFPKGQHDDLIDALAMQIAFWVEQMDFSRMTEEEKEPEPHSGIAVIKELIGRFSDVKMHPFDGGNMEDRYLEDITSPELRKRIRESIEQSRMDAIVAA
jgi:predicted phage terminase large subunit-like protein